jgi:hypothetical protein
MPFYLRSSIYFPRQGIRLYTPRHPSRRRICIFYMFQGRARSNKYCRRRYIYRDVNLRPQTRIPHRVLLSRQEALRCLININSLRLVGIYFLPKSVIALLTSSCEGIFMGLLVSFILLSIISVGIAAVSSLQVPYGAFDKDMGPAAQKKSQ